MGFIGRYLESPPFRENIDTGDLAASGVFNKGYKDAVDPEAKYLPFNVLVITNESGQRLLLTMGSQGEGI